MEYVAHMGERGGADRVLVVNLRERNRLEEIGLDGKVISNSIFKKWDVGIDWIDLTEDEDR
jgi:hypothetical protein